MIVEIAERKGLSFDNFENLLNGEAFVFEGDIEQSGLRAKYVYIRCPGGYLVLITKIFQEHNNQLAKVFKLKAKLLVEPV